MISLKSSLKRISGLVGLMLLVTSCIGAGQGRPLPTPAATATAAAVIDQPVVPAATSEAEIDQAEGSTAPNEAVAEEVEAVPTRIPAEKYADLEIVTLLPRDAIPAIDNPLFLTADEADDFYDPDELVMGVTFNGDTRAYSVPFLSGHEIVNDTVGGVKIAVTW